MMFFDRRRGAVATDPTPDEVLVPLSVDDARWLVTTVAAALRSVGMEVIYDGAGMLQGIDGRRYGLTSLAAILGETPRRRWATATTEHANTLLAANQNPAPRTLADIEQIVLPRLTATGPLAADCASVPPTYAPRFAPDLHILAALDYPSHVSTLGADEALDSFGGWSAVESPAFANLRALPTPAHHAVRSSDERTDADVHVFESEDYHGASRVLLLPELLTSVGGVEPPRHGFLFVVPDRHLVAAHAISGPGVIPATRLLMDIVLTEYGAGPGKVSPYLYYRSADGRVEQLSHRHHGELVMGATACFAATLREIGLLD